MAPGVCRTGQCLGVEDEGPACPRRGGCVGWPCEAVAWLAFQGCCPAGGPLLQPQSSVGMFPGAGVWGAAGMAQRCSALRVWTSSQTLPRGRCVFLTRLLTGTVMACDKILLGPGPAAPSPSCPSIAPSVCRAWNRLCWVPWTSCWRGPGQRWPGTWPPSRPSLVASGCQREENLIFTRLIVLEQYF